MENLKKALCQWEEKLLLWVLKPSNKNIFEKAQKTFLGDKLSEYGHEGFNQWIVCDYRTKEGKSIGDIYGQTHELDEEEKIYLKTISSSFLSLFKDVTNGNSPCVQDQLDKSNYSVLEPFSLNGGIGRLYQKDGNSFFLESCEEMETELQSQFINRVMEAYNRYCVLHGPQTMAIYRKKESSFIYELLQAVHVAGNIDGLDDEDYRVFQGVYGIRSINAVKNKLLSDGRFHHEEEIYRYIDENTHEILAEIFISDQILEIECTEPSHLKKVSKQLEETLGEDCVHIRNEVIQLEDLLEI